MLIEISPVQRKPPRRFPVSQNLTTVRERIQAQGFCGLSDAMYAQINYPLRLSPAICMVWAAVGTALASPTILWALVPFAVLGAILPGHPFDVLYNYWLRHLVGKPMLPRYGKRRRMACLMGATTVGAVAWAFQTGIPMLGYLLGALLVTITFVQVSTGICMPSIMMRVLFGKVACRERAG